jgi:aminopeptidase N
LVPLISRYTTSIFWKYLTDEQRLTYQKEITKQLWSQLQKTLPPNIKKTLFSAYKSLAYNGSSKENLFKVWNKDLQISNLKLNTDDYTELAMDLLLYGHSEREQILNAAKEALTNPDKLERFIFLLPSLSDDIQVKNQFFESLKQEKNRAKESWVANAMNNMNHPLHQKEAIAYLRPSLDLLADIQKTGDIFFPKRWLNSTVGNYNSAAAYQVLQEFLADNPNLNPSLKLKLLQASDDLRRAQLLHKRVDKSVN